MKPLFFFAFILFIFAPAFGQLIENPNFGSKTHPTISILSIDKLSNSTHVYFNVVNKSAAEDWLCVDKNTYIITANNKLKLQQTKGIGNCPDNFKFTHQGQELNFTLTFPAFSPETKYIDLVEECSNFCFKFSGLIVNNEINATLNLAYAQFRQNKLTESAQSFETALQQLGNYPYAIFTYNLVEIYSKLKNKEKLAEWKMKFNNSAFADKKLYQPLIENIQ
ncbi:MAG TPA: hypothetical protein DCQ31_17330 [Bacteroidales bacterium]|nr:hypothetical protein [Bacteroidales bacterium]